MISEEVKVKKQFIPTVETLSKLIQKACEFQSDIWIEYEGKKANAKSLLGIMSMKISECSILKIITDGIDEQAAYQTIKEYIA